MEWINVNDRLPKHRTYVLVKFISIINEEMRCVCHFCEVAQHAFKNSPMIDKWYAYPGAGHEINPTHWMEIPK